MRIGVGLPFKDKEGLPLDAAGLGQRARWIENAGLLGAWHGGDSLARAARDYDGWLCSAGRTTVGTIVEGIKRYRDLGGTRAIVATCPVDLTAPDVPLADDEPFTLRCGPAQAAERLAWLASLGFDDVMLNLRDPGATGPFESDITLEQPQQLRSLLPEGRAS